jgi:hypothetical protein
MLKLGGGVSPGNLLLLVNLTVTIIINAVNNFRTNYSTL